VSTPLATALGTLARELRSVGADALATEARAAARLGDTAEGRAAAASVAYWGGHACPMLMEPAAAVVAALAEAGPVAGRRWLDNLTRVNGRAH
jgi:hypothetical protein